MVVVRLAKVSALCVATVCRRAVAACVMLVNCAACAAASVGCDAELEHVGGGTYTATTTRTPPAPPVLEAVASCGNAVGRVQVPSSRRSCADGTATVLMGDWGVNRTTTPVTSLMMATMRMWLAGVLAMAAKARRRLKPELVVLIAVKSALMTAAAMDELEVAALTTKGNVTTAEGAWADGERVGTLEVATPLCVGTATLEAVAVLDGFVGWVWAADGEATPGGVTVGAAALLLAAAAVVAVPALAVGVAGAAADSDASA